MKMTDMNELETWSFRSRKTDFEKQEKLFLYPELNCSSCVDDCYGTDQNQFEYYCDYLRRHYPDEWEADSVSIYWSVEPVGEHAPCEANVDAFGPKNFLAFYTDPTNVMTCDPIDWFTLPVRNERFPIFAKQLGWLPAPFQSHAPIRSIWESKNDVYSRKMARAHVAPPSAPR